MPRHPHDCFHLETRSVGLLLSLPLGIFGITITWPWESLSFGCLEALSLDLLESGSLGLYESGSLDLLESGSLGLLA